MRSKYNFAKKINNDRLKKEIVILPVSRNDSPNLEYMKDIIRDLSNNVIFNNKDIVTKKRRI